MRKIKPKSESEMYGPLRSKGKKAFYPHLNIDLDQLPEAKKWELNKTYHIEMDVKMTSKSESKFQQDAGFDIIAIGTEDEEDDADKQTKAEDDAEEKGDEEEEEDED